MAGLGLDPPERPVLNYDTPPRRSAGLTALAALAGVGGYVLLLWGNLYCVGMLLTGVSGWAALPVDALPPLAVMAGLSYLFKSRAMMLGAVITCVVFSLACGTCLAIVQSIH